MNERNYLIYTTYWNFGQCSSPEAQAMRHWAEAIAKQEPRPKRVVIIGVGDSCQPPVREALADYAPVQWIPTEGVVKTFADFHDTLLDTNDIALSIAELEKTDLVEAPQDVIMPEGWVSAAYEMRDDCPFRDANGIALWRR